MEFRKKVNEGLGVGAMTIAEVFQNQLYFLFNELEMSVEHRDTTGSIIGYSVVNGLFAFENTRPKRNARRGANISYGFLKPIDVDGYRRGEIGRIYAALKKSIDQTQADGAELTLLSMADQCDANILPIIEGNSRYEGESVLLDRIIHNMIGQKDYADILRRRGLSLLDHVKTKKACRRMEDIAREDYSAIRKTFLEQKLSSYQDR